MSAAAQRASAPIVSTSRLRRLISLKSDFPPTPSCAGCVASACTAVLDATSRWSSNQGSREIVHHHHSSIAKTYKYTVDRALLR